MAGGHPVLGDLTPFAEMLRDELYQLMRAAQEAGFGVQSPTVQVALLELHGAKAQANIARAWLDIAERALDELKRRRSRDY